ncbi:sce7726 family protein [Pedobacter sp. AW31-3R]|uniref:sce7726 family protein n=1 Tax=Pedobacter sp. AW31-3R TaxID=3445781 RepID=UPI003FA062F1
MKFTDQTIIDAKLVKEVVKSYNTLDYSPRLKELLRMIFPGDSFNGLCKLDLHRMMNELVVRSYGGEQVVKYALFKAFKNKNVVGAYEIKVKSSRVDFLTINGHTTSFEIKSNLDNLDKLAKQSADYSSAFEFNNVVIDERHLKKCLAMIPEQFGIITVDSNEHHFLRKPKMSKHLDPIAQLALMTKKELVQNFGLVIIEDILKSNNSETINDLFKVALKDRYRSRWEFIVEHSVDILPIDIQFFFNKNIKPAQIYT